MADSQPYDTSRYPLNSPWYDADITNGALVQSLVDHSIPFSETPVLDYFEVTDGQGGGQDVYRNLNPAEPSFVELMASSRAQRREARIFFFHQDGSRRIPVSLSRADFVALLEQNEVPPGFVEVFVNNNGARSASITYSPESCIPEAFHLFIKFPMAPALNGSIYFRYDVPQKRTTCLIFGMLLTRLERRLQQIFPQSQASARSPSPLTKDPFLILSALFSEYSSILEDERRDLDFNVRERESRTGMGALVYSDSLRASAAQYAALVKELHVTEALLMFFVRTVEYQADCIEFLLEQHKVFIKLLQDDTMATGILRSHKAQESLNLSASFSRNRLSQVKTMSRRIQVQLNVVANLIGQNDSRANISIAEQSARIAAATQTDNIALRTIAILTMLFLPGTFIATFFAMPFFHVGSEDEVKLTVDSKLWLYPAVTIPATTLVFILWYGWSGWMVASATREKKGHPIETVLFDDKG